MAKTAIKKKPAKAAPKKCGEASPIHWTGNYDEKREYRIGDLVVGWDYTTRESFLFMRVGEHEIRGLDPMTDYDFESPKVWERLSTDHLVRTINTHSEKMEGMRDDLHQHKIRIDCLIAWIQAYNRLPWYARLFRKRSPFKVENLPRHPWKKF